MPELPEGETTRRGLAPYLTGARITWLVVRERRLRWPVEKRLPALLKGQRLEAIGRRGKYLIFEFEAAALLIHLGMSGHLRLVEPAAPHRRHDHLDFIFNNNRVMRFHDPRRFGSVLYLREQPLEHPLLKTMGPEPLGNSFTGADLHKRSIGRRLAVKSFIMDAHIVAGVGNIYASEALFLAGIHPRRAAGRISLDRYQHLATRIRDVLAAAVEKGGTTLRDFVNGTGEPGYFAQHLNVYGREGGPCKRCPGTIRQQVIGQRASYYCPRCQH